MNFPLIQILNGDRQDDGTVGSDAQTVSDVFTVVEERAFVLLSDHAGNTWNLEILKPGGDQDEDDDWVNIGMGSGGMRFTANGLISFYAQPWLNYRLRGGTAGANAWLISSARSPGLK